MCPGCGLRGPDKMCGSITETPASHKGQSPEVFRVFVSSKRHRTPTRPTGRLVPHPRSCFSTVRNNEKPGSLW